MIYFDSENIAMPTLDQPTIRTWIEAVAKSHGFEVGRLSYLFCDDESILAANRKFLGHDYYTDIITFDYTRPARYDGDVCIRPAKIGGDMIISLDTVRSNAEERGLEYDRELLRVIIHGVLHLCGINDKGPGEREIMEANEDEALAMFSSI